MLNWLGESITQTILHLKKKKVIIGKKSVLWPTDDCIINIQITKSEQCVLYRTMEEHKICSEFNFDQFLSHPYYCDMS